MTNITELTAKLKAAALKLNGAQWQARKGFSGIEVIVKGSVSKGRGCESYQPVAADVVDNQTAKAIALFSPANVLALIDALEAAEKRIADLANELCAIEAIRNDAVFVTDEHYEQCPTEVQKIIGKLAEMLLPATDRFLAEQRAQGVEMLASLAGKECQRHKSVNDRAGVRKWKSIVILCSDFASQLRKEVKG